MAEQRQNNETRREMLAAIRAHLATSAPFDAVHDEHQAAHEVRQLESQSIALASVAASSIIDRFRESLEAVGGHCVVVRNEVEAAGTVRGIIERMKAARVAYSNSILVQRVLESVKSDVEWLDDASASELFSSDVGITGAQWAIAETGTLVLESKAERHRLASLVPPVHIAIIEAGRIRQMLGEALALVGEGGRDGMSRTITFITGPSRTSDIELTLAIGVHGPGELYVIIIGGEQT